MSSGEDIQVTYYSTLLAKAVKESDGDAFTDLWDRINLVANKQEAEDAKDRAHELSNNASINVLDIKLKWLESHGVKPLPAKPKDVEEVTEIKVGAITGDTDTIDNYTGISSTGESIDHFSSTTNLFTGQKERSLVEIYNKMPMESQPKNPFHNRDLSFIDSVDDETTPLLNKRLGNRQENENKNLGSVNKNLGYVSINMPNEVDSNINFNLGAETKTSFNANAFNSYFQPSNNNNMFEMSEMEGSSRWDKNEEMILQSVEESDEDVENKKSKKRKKRKSKEQAMTPENQETKEVETIENNDEKSMKSSRNIRRKKLKEEARKISTPVNDTNNNVKPIEKKKKKMTVKQYKEEQARKSNLGHKVEEKKKQEEKNCRPADVLDDETVARILKSVGAPAAIPTETKKKSNKDKTVLTKKDKKKSKKNKKVLDEDKRVDVKESEAGKEKPSEEIPSEKTAELNFNDENTDDFVTQQRRSRRVANNKTPAFSGRASPTNTGIRKRRFSDPSPSVTKIVPGSKSGATTSYENRDLYDHQDWPLLTSELAEKSGTSNTLSRASYASKLKSNLDSTGCSLASSSEDGGSSSSSSSNSCSNAVNELDLNMTSQFLSVAAVSSVAAATTDMLKCLTERIQQDEDKNSKKDKKLQKKNKLDGENAKPENLNESNSGGTQKVTAKNFDSSDSTKQPVVNVDGIATKPQCDKAQNSATNKQSDNMEDIVRNEWGLDFFITEEQSLLTPVFNIDIDMLDKGDFELTFGDDVIMEIPSVEPPRQIADDVMSINSSPSKWNDAGDFNLNMAAKFLNKEWQSSLAKGTFYK